MRILIVNDDGINAQGIITLAETLRDEHEVYVIAPDGECSGFSHYMHFQVPVSYSKIDAIEGCECYALEGTPCDCVKFGLGHIMKDNPPDIVLSGINNGVNIASDVIYSGTVNAAIEAGMCGVKAIAVSLRWGRTQSFKYAADFVRNNLEKFYGIADKVLSINIPSADGNEIQGIKFTEVGINKFNDEYQDVPSKGKYGKSYMLTGEMIKPISRDNTIDLNALFNNYITISPIKAVFTHFESLEKIRDTELWM